VRTKWTLQTFLRAVVNDSTVQDFEWVGGPNDIGPSFHHLGIKGFRIATYKSTLQKKRTTLENANYTYPSSVRGWQFLGDKQNSTITDPEKHLVWLRHLSSGSNEPTLTQFLRTEFHLNLTTIASMSKEELMAQNIFESKLQGIVPYNSNIWFRGKTVSLAAPFLSLGTNW